MTREEAECKRLLSAQLKVAEKNKKAAEKLIAQLKVLLARVKSSNKGEL